MTYRSENCKIADILAPAASRRRAYLDLTRSGLAVIRDEGWSEFRRKVNRWLRLRMASSRGPKLRLPKFDRSILRHPTRDIVLPSPSADPDVSIIIPVYNKLVFTLNCLKSIAENTTGDFEVVVVDDCSIDGTFEVLSGIRNLSIVRNGENSGFVDTCNRGARESKGKYLLFLNNDTMVTDDWLPPLLKSIRDDSVGIVGSKLIFPNGTIQEAGGVVFNDGSAWNYGMGDNPNKPEYNFVRPVDYVSGACLLVKRELFERVEGFDVRFKPGYFEDTDLCFAIRALGFRVVYQPRSLVVHFEGVTSGKDVSTGIKKFQAINQPKFASKWANVLKQRHLDPGETNVFTARQRKSGQNVLVVDKHVPTYDRDSGSLRMFNILKIMTELGHRVTFIGDVSLKVEPYTSELQDSGVEVLYSPHAPSVEGYLKTCGRYFQTVILSRHDVAAKYLDLVRRYCGAAQVVYDTVDLAYLRESRRAEVEKNPGVMKQAEAMKTSELSLARSSDITLVVSTVEEKLLKQEDPSLRVEILSNIHEIAGSARGFEDRSGLLFVGNFDHLPNSDACLWFVREVLPLVKRQLPSVKFFIVGNNPSSQIKGLASQDIEVTGFVEDLKPYFDNCRVFVAPLRYGAGVKGKINQSMSHGLPVVTTSIGAEGMGAADGEAILIADKPGDFADKITLAYSDSEIWRMVSANSLRNVRSCFSREAARTALSSLVGHRAG